MIEDRAGDVRLPWRGRSSRQGRCRRPPARQRARHRFMDALSTSDVLEPMMLFTEAVRVIRSNEVGSLEDRRQAEPESKISRQDHPNGGTGPLTALPSTTLRGNNASHQKNISGRSRGSIGPPDSDTHGQESQRAPPSVTNASCPLSCSAGRRPYLAAMLTNILTSLLLGAAPKVGELAPDFTATDTEGRQLTLSKLVERGPVILAFFPKAFTSG